MKKLKVAAILFSVCLLFSACGSQSDAPKGEEAKQEAETQKDTPTKVEVDENLLTVDILFPASFYEDTDMSDFDADEYASKNGFEKAVVNEDGSILVTMTKAKHREIMSDLLQTIEESFAELIGAEDTPYVVAINHTDDFRKIDVVVEREGYENGGILPAFIPLQLYIQSGIYQVFNGDESYAEISFVDSATNETIASATYPNDLNSN